MKSVGDKPKMKVDDLSTNNSGGPNQLGFQNNVRFFDVIRLRKYCPRRLRNSTYGLVDQRRREGRSWDTWALLC